MAGDWIKMTHALPEKPEVLAIAGKTGFNRFEVVGRLFTLWRWFDINTTDGNAVGVTSVTLDECLFGYSANAVFVSSVLAVRWLRETEDGIAVVKFDEHISESAKTRAQTAKRVAKSKSNAKANAEGNGESVTSSVTKTVPREEKRREEKKEEKKEEKTPRAQAPVILLPEWLPQNLWDAWQQRSKAKKMTQDAADVVIAKLGRWRDAGEDWRGSLENAAIGGYQGLFLPKDKGSAHGVTVPSAPGRDPALLKIEEDEKVTKPPTLETLARLAELRKPRLGAH